jgi:hypothetical protein
VRAAAPRRTARQRTAPERTAPERSALSLRDQIAALEAELMDQWSSAWPRPMRPPPARVGGAPRLLSASELERVRDDLARRAGDLRKQLDACSRDEQDARRLKEELLLAPEEYAWVRVSNSDMGEPGCRHWHVQPRLGLLGRLLKWWRVRISSGCP